MPAQAVEAEAAAFLDSHGEERTADGPAGWCATTIWPEREIMTGTGPVAVRAPRGS